MHVIAGKAVAFREAQEPAFRAYQEQVLGNARAMAETVLEHGYDVVSGGTDNHLFLMDFIRKGITGKDAEAALGRANITVNKNTVPNDPQSPFVTSGLRIGSPALTTRGMGEVEARQVASWMCEVIDAMSDEGTIERVRNEVVGLCRRFPVYGGGAR